MIASFVLKDNNGTPAGSLFQFGLFLFLFSRRPLKFRPGKIF
jgi:hypothetical protein